MKNWYVGLLALVVALMLAACGSDEVNGNGKSNEDNQVENSNAQNISSENGEDSQADNANAQSDDSESTLKTQYPLTITDASGLEFTFEQAPQRIVSIAPHQTEILFAIGLGDRIVGVSEFDNYPEEASTKPKVGNIQGNAEALLAVQPDLVFAGLSLNGTSVGGLRDLGVQVFTTEPTTIDEVIESILTIGVITDAQEEAEKVAAKMREDKQLVIDTVSGLTEAQKKSVYIEYDPLWTAGKGSFMDEMIVLSGGINIASDLDPWAQISSEAVIAANPDVIIYADVNDYETGNPLIETIKSRPGWGEITAMKDNAITGINADILSRNGPRITDALVQIAMGIYPELFAK